MEFDDILNDITEDIKTAGELEISKPEFPVLYFNRCICVVFGVQSSARQNGRPETEDICRRYMELSGFLAGNELDVSLVYDYEHKQLRSWMATPLAYLTVQWNGTFGRSSRRIITFLNMMFTIVRKMCGLNPFGIQVYTKAIGEFNYKTLCKFNNISSGYPLHSAIKMIMTEPEYFDANKGLHDAVDGLYELVTRMLQADGVLCKETMKYMTDRTMGVLKSHPIFNSVRGMLFSEMSGSPVLKKPDDSLLQRDCGSFLIDDLNMKEQRVIFLSKTIRKKKDMVKIELFSDKDDDSYGITENTLDIFRRAIEEGNMSILSVRSYRDKDFDMYIYALSPIFEGNEMFYCMLFEKRNRDKKLDMSFNDVFSYKK